MDKNKIYFLFKVFLYIHISIYICLILVVKISISLVLFIRNRNVLHRWKSLKVEKQKTLENYNKESENIRARQVQEYGNNKIGNEGVWKNQDSTQKNNDGHQLSD